VRFSQFYNNAKCTTTRASILTGLYPRNGGRGSQLLNPQVVTIGEVLREAGYQTALVGKWHLGSGAPHRPCDRGFDESYGLWSGCCNFFNPALPDPDYKGGKVRPFGHNAERVTEFPEDYYTTDAFSDHAIKTVKRFAAKDQPFLLHLTYTAPHYPLHAKPEVIAKYRGKFKMGWQKLREQRYQRQIAMGLIDPKTCPLSEADSRMYSWDESNQDWEDMRMAVYAAMIDSVDQNIGRLLKTLEDLNIDKNTVVMFLSDNGGCAEEPGGAKLQRNPVKDAGGASTYMTVGPSWGWAQNAPFKRYKATTHEGGVRTPMIVRWPGKVKPGTITHQPGHIIDLMATFVELARTEYPKTYKGQDIVSLEGKSLVPILLGKEREPHEYLAWHWGGNRAVREGDWKLVWDKEHRRWALYDLATDQSETRDLSASRPDLVKKLADRWYAWAEMTDVKYPADTKK
jgi:arylsulfatase